MEIAIINEELFKENSPVRDNAVITEFVPYIILAQKMYIIPLIGRALVKRIQKAIEDSLKEEPIPIPPDIQALIVEIAPCLSFYAVYQGLPFHWAGIQNKGITLADSENSKSIDGKDLGQLLNWLRRDAQLWAASLLTYLKGCRQLYPDWQPPADCDCDDTKPEPPKLNFGISIPDKRRRTC